MITLTNAQLRELQSHVEGICSILGLSLTDSAAAAHRPQPATRRAASSPAPRLQPATFTYLHASRYPQRLTRLYQCLLKGQWIDARTTLDDFHALFCGADSPVRIRWQGKTAWLYYLIRRAVERGLLVVPRGARTWRITESHFLDRTGRPFHNLRKQRVPKRAVPAIEALVDILDPSVGGAA